MKKILLVTVILFSMSFCALAAGLPTVAIITTGETIAEKADLKALTFWILVTQVCSDVAKDWGVTVTLNQYINSARDVRKTQTTFAGDDGSIIKKAVDSGVEGIVIEGVGAGNVNAETFKAIKYALAKGSALSIMGDVVNYSLSYVFLFIATHLLGASYLGTFYWALSISSLLGEFAATAAPGRA